MDIPWHLGKFCQRLQQGTYNPQANLLSMQPISLRKAIKIPSLEPENGFSMDGQDLNPALGVQLQRKARRIQQHLLWRCRLSGQQQCSRSRRLHSLHAGGKISSWPHTPHQCLRIHKSPVSLLSSVAVAKAGRFHPGGKLPSATAIPSCKRLHQAWRGKIRLEFVDRSKSTNFSC